MTITNHGHVGMTMNNGDIMQNHFFMDLMMNGNGDKIISFGYPHDSNLQNGFWPYLLP